MLDYEGFIGTVGERLTSGETKDVAARLPAELRRCFDDATFLALIGDDEFHDTTEQLPGEYLVLLRRG